MTTDADQMNMKEIDADRAALLARNYFEKDKKAEKKKDAETERATDRILADWREITISSTKRGRKDFTVECELYDEPAATTRTKYTFKISKTGEIKKVSKETK